MKKAFTLTEILITLSIIGVIAALTIPAVLKGYRERVYSSQLKKTVAQIENAAKAIMTDEHAQSFYETSASMKRNDEDLSVGAPYFLRNYFKVARDCVGASVTNCGAKEDSYKSIKGASIPHFGYGDCILTVNGAAICMWNAEEVANTSLGVDINGSDAPNIVGIDTFVFYFKNNGFLEDIDTDVSKCGVNQNEWNHIVDYAHGCFKRVLDNNWKIEE